MKYQVTYLMFLILLLLACENKSKHADSFVYDDKPMIEPSASDTTFSFQEKSHTAAASASSSSSSSHSQKSISYDNMRGFDPVSEDDMDDNGMRRYMENNDEEGWD